MNTFFLFLLIFRASFPNTTPCCVNISKRGTVPLGAPNLKLFCLTILLSLLPKIKIKYFTLKAQITLLPQCREETSIFREKFGVTVYSFICILIEKLSTQSQVKSYYMHLNEDYFSPLSLRMMTQMLEALLSSSERAGTSRSHFIELWRPLIHVYKTT